MLANLSQWRHRASTNGNFFDDGVGQDATYIAIFEYAMFLWFHVFGLYSGQGERAGLEVCIG